MRDVSISKERDPFRSVQTRSIIVNNEIDLFRSGGHIDRFIATLSVRPEGSVVSIRENAINRSVAGRDLERSKDLIGRDTRQWRGN